MGISKLALWESGDRKVSRACWPAVSTVGEGWAQRGTLSQEIMRE